MILYLVRHGDYTKSAIDPTEGLSIKGKTRIELLKKGLKSHDVNFDLLLSSPKKRAVETASILGDDILTTDHLKPSADIKALHQFLESQDKKSLLAVGHLPLLENFVFELTGDSAMFGPGSIAKIVTHQSEMPTLEWILTPEEITEDVQ